MKPIPPYILSCLRDSFLQLFKQNKNDSLFAAKPEFGPMSTPIQTPATSQGFQTASKSIYKK